LVVGDVFHDDAIFCQPWSIPIANDFVLAADDCKLFQHAMAVVAVT